MPATKDIMLLPISELDQRADNVEIQDFDHSTTPSTGEGVSRYRQVLSDGRPLDALLVNKESETLVVSLHGALDRKKFSLPRFERVQTLLNRNVSILALGDPGLHGHAPELSKNLELTWFTGPVRCDYFPPIAKFIRTISDTIGARQIIVSGSSGGGFASLQLAPLVGATALVFNPQTEVHRYVLPNGSVWAQRNYIQALAQPIDPGLDSLGKIDWTTPLGDRLSAIRRFASQDYDVTYATNINDWHHQQHFAPFMKNAELLGKADRVTVIEYDDGNVHRPPNGDVFLSALDTLIG